MSFVSIRYQSLQNSQKKKRGPQAFSSVHTLNGLCVGLEECLGDLRAVKPDSWGQIGIMIRLKGNLH